MRSLALACAVLLGGCTISFHAAPNPVALTRQEAAMRRAAQHLCQPGDTTVKDPNVKLLLCGVRK